MDYKLPAELFRDIPTPFYYYDMSLLADTLALIQRAKGDDTFQIHYAVKACVDRPVLEMIACCGFGADVVSGGELDVALQSGFRAEDIVFAGVGKSDAEIVKALDAGIGCFNVESLEELEVIEEIAAGKGMVADVALRVNPEIDAHTHHYITTGLAENKFGIAMKMLDAAVSKCLSSGHLALKGLHFHIGSQITDLTPYKILCERVNRLQETLAGKGVKLEAINVGGGLGIDYDDPDRHPFAPFEEYFRVFRDNLVVRDGQKVHFELGRAVVAQCGSLVTRVLYVKKGVEKEFVVVDAGMTDLIRPALYQAHHVIQNLTSTAEEKRTYDVVGPICESSDVFAEKELLPLTRRGDLLALRSAGAYGRIMASRYNCRPIAEAVFSQGSVG